MSRKPILAITTLAVFAGLACAPEPEPLSTETSTEELRFLPQPVRVVSRNMYVGANVDLVIAALATRDPTDEQVALVGAIQTFVATDLPSRARAMAREIAWTRPDFVGLQEVWYVDIAIPGLVTVQVDFLTVLQAELAALGQNYTVAAQVRTTAATLPGVHLADGDAILVRQGRVTVHEADGQLFQANAGDVGAGFPIVRGWTMVRATVRHHEVQFINAHLESGNDPLSAGLRAWQAAELAQLARPDLPVIVVGDLNDDPGSAMHNVLTGAGFTDAWPALRRASGETCCHADDLWNPTPNLTSRIDYVMTRGFDYRHRAVRGWIHLLGARAWEKFPGPQYELWASDHAGLAATLLLPRGR